MTFVDFFYTLRDYGVPVDGRYVLDFHRALDRGLASDVDEMYVLLRLICIKKMEHIDAFERAFARHFFDLNLPAPGRPIDLDSLLESKPFRQWLSEYMEREGLAEKQIRWDMPPEELLQRFLDTISKQKGAHHGGGKWVGTGGYSPYGHSGYSNRGYRIGGQSRNRSALKVIGERRYTNYAARSELREENIRQALGAVKHMVPVGPKTELDLDETVKQAARNAGEIEPVFRSEMRDKVKVILLIDNGGYSMDWFVPLVELVFSKMRDRFKEMKIYYFHNCIYGKVFMDPGRIKGVPTDSLLQQRTDTRVMVIGDASMAPEELIMPHGSIEYGVDDSEPALGWLGKLRERFPHIVWLNPKTRDTWQRTRGSYTIFQVGGVIPMEDMTLEGIRNAVEILNMGVARGRVD